MSPELQSIIEQHILNNETIASREARILVNEILRLEQSLLELKRDLTDEETAHSATQTALEDSRELCKNLHLKLVNEKGSLEKEHSLYQCEYMRSGRIADEAIQWKMRAEKAEKELEGALHQMDTLPAALDAALAEIASMKSRKVKLPSAQDEHNVLPVVSARAEAWNACLAKCSAAVRAAGLEIEA